VVADLAHGLAEAGHEVDLVTIGESRAAVPLVVTSQGGLSDRLGSALPEVRHLALARQHILESCPDVVHDHTLSGPLLSAGLPCPMVHTVHGNPIGEYGDYLRALGDSVHLVAISQAQRNLAADLNWAGTVPNAIRVGEFPFRSDKQDQVVFLGRFNEEKAPHLAIDVARAAGRRIELIGRCAEPAERAYFDAEIAPRLGDDAVYVGEVEHAEKLERLSRAAAFVFPLQWDEPFGLVIIESLACGTPVVALARGAVPEILRDGVTGFVRENLAELPEALSQIDRISPAECRADVERRYDVATMVQGYLDVYADVLAAPSAATMLRARPAVIAP
jgi:glycosyltransferase involved in cell wall biosynthesis